MQQQFVMPPDPPAFDADPMQQQFVMPPDPQSYAPGPQPFDPGSWHDPYLDAPGLPGSAAPTPTPRPPTPPATAPAPTPTPRPPTPPATAPAPTPTPRPPTPPATAPAPTPTPRPPTPPATAPPRPLRPGPRPPRLQRRPDPYAQAPDPPGYSAGPDPYAQAPDPPGYSGPDPYADAAIDQAAGPGAQMAAADSAPGQGLPAAAEPSAAGQAAHDAAEPMVAFSIAAGLVDESAAASGQRATGDGLPAAQPAAGAQASSIDSKLVSGEVLWLDGSNDRGVPGERWAEGFPYIAPSVNLQPDPGTPSQWLITVDDVVVARVDTPDGGAPAVGMLRDFDRLQIVVNLPPGGTLAETSAPINQHIDIYSFTSHDAGAQSPPAAPGTSPPQTGAIPPRGADAGAVPDNPASLVPGEPARSGTGADGATQIPQDIPTAQPAAAAQPPPTPSALASPPPQAPAAATAPPSPSPPAASQASTGTRAPSAPSPATAPLASSRAPSAGTPSRASPPSSDFERAAREIQEMIDKEVIPTSKGQQNPMSDEHIKNVLKVINWATKYAKGNTLQERINNAWELVTWNPSPIARQKSTHNSESLILRDAQYNLWGRRFITYQRKESVWPNVLIETFASLAHDGYSLGKMAQLATGIQPGRATDKPYSALGGEVWYQMGLAQWYAHDQYHLGENVKLTPPTLEQVKIAHQVDLAGRAERGKAFYILFN